MDQSEGALTPSQLHEHWNEHLKTESSVYGGEAQARLPGFSGNSESVARNAPHRMTDVSIHLERKPRLPDEFGYMRSDNSPTIRVPQPHIRADEVGLDASLSAAHSPTPSSHRTRHRPPPANFTPQNPACSPSLARTLAAQMHRTDAVLGERLPKQTPEVYSGQNFSRYLESCQHNHVSHLNVREKGFDV